MIKIKIGNIFDSHMSVLVNTVNCVGVMGKGIAKEFKEKYPLMYKQYHEMCLNHEIKTGEVYPYYEDGCVRILNFPTKQHWRSPSKIEYIEEGLDYFVSHYEKWQIHSVAFPPLGCGNGGLDWKTIGALMVKKLQDLPIDIEIYAPFGVDRNLLIKDNLLTYNSSNTLSGVIYNKINTNWYLVLHLIQCLSKNQYSIRVGRTVFQKMCYILTRYGTDLGLSFSRNYYGPYSSDIKDMIMILSNNNLITEKQCGNMLQIYVSDQFKIDKSMYSKQDKENVNKTYQLFKRIKDTEQAELICTIIYSFDELKKNHSSITENELLDYLQNWKKKYKTQDYEFMIRDVCQDLTYMNMIDVDYSRDYIINDNY